jgi:hypothetical protein
MEKETKQIAEKIMEHMHMGIMHCFTKLTNGRIDVDNITILLSIFHIKILREYYIRVFDEMYTPYLMLMDRNFYFEGIRISEGYENCIIVYHQYASVDPRYIYKADAETNEFPFTTESSEDSRVKRAGNLLFEAMKETSIARNEPLIVDCKGTLDGAYNFDLRATISKIKL